MISKSSTGRQPLLKNFGGTSRQSAILILGPTGSGKTPLGNFLEKHGLAGRKCLHFDFGASLRNIGDGKMVSASLIGSDLEVVRRVLETGALLEDSEFHIAGRILKDFVESRCSRSQDLVVLNGLPRHAGQARDIEKIVNVLIVVCLDCSADVVFDRISHDTGGDRKGRIDDNKELIRGKLKIFRKRTLPLLDHYRASGVKVENITVTKETRPRDIAGRITEVFETLVC